MTKRAGKKSRASRKVTGGESPIKADTTARHDMPAASRAGLIATGEDKPAGERDLAALGASVFWPELEAAAVAQSLATGRGEAVKFLQGAKECMQAVRERYPIPREMRERIILDAYIDSRNTSLTPKERMMARKLLLMMDAANIKPNSLPDQVASVSAGGDVSITVNQVFAMLGERGQGDGDIDFRDEIVIPGSANDYAE